MIQRVCGLDKSAQVDLQVRTQSLFRFLPHQLNSSILPYIRLHTDILTADAVVCQVGTTGANSQPKELVELFLQILSSPEHIKGDEIVLDVRRWFPQRQELSASATEVVLPRDATIFQLKTILSSPNGTSNSTHVVSLLPGKMNPFLNRSLSGNADIPLQFLCIAKPFAYQIKKRDQWNTIATLNWLVDDASGLTTSPWYLQDGDCLLFKDDREAEILPETSVESSGSSRRVVERSLQIRTFYDEEAEIQAAIQASLEGN